MDCTRLYHSVLLFSSLAAILACVNGQTTVQTSSQVGATFPNSVTEAALVEGKNMSTAPSNFSDRTRRIDPLDGLKKYEGGYNITSKHYWSSTVYTGRYGFFIGVIWLIGGIVYAAILVTKTGLTLNKKEQKPKKMLPCYKRFCYLSVVVGIFLTFLAIAASTVTFAGSSKFYSRAESIKNIIVEIADNASTTIHNVTEYLVDMQNTTEIYGDFNGSENLNSTLQKLDDEATNIQRKAETSMKLVNKGINILKMVTVITIVLNLIALVGLFISRPLRLRRTFYILVILCWLFTFLFWIYFGLYFFLDKFSNDTCAALEEYQLNPENSTLSLILPCSQKLSDNNVLQEVRAGIHNIIDKVNAKISAVKASAQPDLEYVCNPFLGGPYFSYQPSNCSPNTTDIGQIPEILKKYTCSNIDGGSCKQGEFISATEYAKVQVYTTSIQDILKAYPSMEKLANCQLVKDAFSNILLNECKPLKKHVRTTWLGLIFLSIIMVAFILSMVFEAHHDYKCHSYDMSIKPQPVSTIQSQFQTSKVHFKVTEIASEV